MAISEVGNHSSANNGTAVSDTHGLTIAANDVVVVMIVSGSGSPTPTFSDNNGAYAFTANDDNDMGGYRVAFFSRVAGASEPAAYAFTRSASGDWCIIVRVFRGVDTANVFDISPIAAANANGTDASAENAGCTTSYDNSLAILQVFQGGAQTLTYSGQTNSFINEKEAPTGTYYCGGASYTKAIASAGAVGATVVTLSTSPAIWGTWMYALRAAASGPSVTTNAITGITASTATSGGVVTNIGGSSLTQYGVCWNTTGTPTTSDPHTTDKP